MRVAAQEQVAWLDREIAREQNLPIVAQPAETPKPPAPGSGRTAPRESTSPLDADKLIERYQSNSLTIKDEVKRGCYIYFFGAFGLLVAGVIIFYLLTRE